MSPLSARPLREHLKTVEIVDDSRAVKFEPVVRTRTIESASQLSDEEHQSIWYTEDELIKIRLHATETILVMMANSDEFPPVDDENSDEYCSRGLRTRDEFSKRQLAIFQSVDAVLNEQHAQRELGIHDDELLADIYYERTWNSQEEAVDGAEAHTRANKDLRTYQEHAVPTKDYEREDTFQHDYQHEIATETL
jgi:hypothetical protein